MADKKLLAMFGIKWNPFVDVPVEALLTTPQVDHFCWRVENLVRDGGFALITGDTGTGKSSTLRILSSRLSRLPDVTVGEITHPQSRVTDFYRELGHLFNVPISASNRWGGFKTLREKWQAHIESTLTRPVLLIDEVQEMPSAVLTELRIISSQFFDSHSVLTVVLAGNRQILDRLGNQDLRPLGSRLRVKLAFEALERDQLERLLRHAIQQAGNPRLVTDEVIQTLAERGIGDARATFGLAAELLDLAVAREAKQIDQKLFLEASADGVRVPRVAAEPRRRRGRR